MPKVSFSYPFSADTVYAFVTDPDEVKKRSETFGESNVVVDVSESGSTKTVTCTRETEVDLPAFAKRIFKPRNTVTDRKEWSVAGDNRIAQLHIDVQGAPTSMDGTITITPQGDSCVYEVSFTTTAKVPLIRKKLEAYIDGLTTEEIKREFEYNKNAISTP